MDAISENLRHDLLQPQFSEGYSESFQDAFVATQIKVLREQNHWTQAELAEKIDTTQTAISRIENVNYSAWTISTLKKLARAFRVRLKVSFETYGSLIHDIEVFSRESLRRVPREEDPELRATNDSKAADYAAVGPKRVLSNLLAFPRERQSTEMVQSPFSERNARGAISGISLAGNNATDIAQQMGATSGQNSTAALPMRQAARSQALASEVSA